MKQEQLTSETRLKGCPFCGKTVPTVFLFSTEEMGESEPFEFCITCDARHGGCGGSGGYSRDKNQAIRNWNGR